MKKTLLNIVHVALLVSILVGAFALISPGSAFSDRPEHYIVSVASR